MKNERGAVILPTMIIVAIIGSFLTGAVKLDHKEATASFHFKEVLEAKKAEYKVNQ